MLFIAYHTICVWLAQQTLGKALLGLRVTRFNKEPGLFWSLGRASGGYFLVDLFGIGLIVALFNRGRQSLHDYVFGSAVTIDDSGPLCIRNMHRRFMRYAEKQLNAVDEKSKAYDLMSGYWALFLRLGKAMESVGKGIESLVGAPGMVTVAAASGKIAATAMATTFVAGAGIATTALVDTRAKNWLETQRCGANCAVTSTFERDAGGWTISGDASGPIHESGEISAMDLRPWYWQAPISYLGDKRGFYGRELSFELKTKAGGGVFKVDFETNEDIVLRSKELALVYEFNEKPKRCLELS